MSDSTRVDEAIDVAVNSINVAIDSIESTVEALQAAANALTEARRCADGDDVTKRDLQAALMALASIKITAAGLVDSVILTVLDRTLYPRG